MTGLKAAMREKTTVGAGSAATFPDGGACLLKEEFTASGAEVAEIYTLISNREWQVKPP